MWWSLETPTKKDHLICARPLDKKIIYLGIAHFSGCKRLSLRLLLFFCPYSNGHIVFCRGAFSRLFVREGVRWLALMVYAILA